jgi:hypothetical protein|tara:strand:+ start:153 stop:326 length:174 start_codon:yes stop_codon:yes gene_type:complete
MNKPIGESIYDAMKDGILDSEELAENLIKWIGWNNEKDLKQFLKSYYYDVQEILKED